VKRIASYVWSLLELHRVYFDVNSIRTLCMLTYNYFLLIEHQELSDAVKYSLLTDNIIVCFDTTGDVFGRFNFSTITKVLNYIVLFFKVWFDFNFPDEHISAAVTKHYGTNRVDSSGQNGDWIFTTLHGMQTRSYSDENSVRVSVRPFVCLSNAWFVTKQKKIVPAFLYHVKDHLPLFWDKKNGWWEANPSTWNFGWNWLRWSEIADFQSIFAHSASAVTLAKKVQLTLTGSPLRVF